MPSTSPWSGRQWRRGADAGSGRLAPDASFLYEVRQAGNQTRVQPWRPARDRLLASWRSMARTAWSGRAPSRWVCAGRALAGPAADAVGRGDKPRQLPQPVRSRGPRPRHAARLVDLPVPVRCPERRRHAPLSHRIPGPGGAVRRLQGPAASLAENRLDPPPLPTSATEKRDGRLPQGAVSPGGDCYAASTCGLVPNFVHALNLTGLCLRIDLPDVRRARDPAGFVGIGPVAGR